MFCDLQCEEAFVGRGPDTDWAEHVQHILQQQVWFDQQLILFFQYS